MVNDLALKFNLSGKGKAEKRGLQNLELCNLIFCKFIVHSFGSKLQF